MIAKRLQLIPRPEPRLSDAQESAQLAARENLISEFTTLDPDDHEFGWTNLGIVIQSSRNDSFNAIDLAVNLTESGQLWMCFGSFWSGLKLIQLDPQTGKRKRGDGPIHSIDNYRQIEATHIYQHDGWCYLFVNWGKCCSGIDSTPNRRVWRELDCFGLYNRHTP